MVKIYDSLRDEMGVQIPGRTKLFIKSDDKNIDNPISGPICVPDGAGTMFIVDDWLIDQLHKVRLYYGRLVVKDGETLEPPVKSELEIEEDQIRKRLMEIESERIRQQYIAERAAAETPVQDPPQQHEHDEIINDDMVQTAFATTSVQPEFNPTENLPIHNVSTDNS